MLDQTKTPKSKNEILLHTIVLDLTREGEEPTIGEVLNAYENWVPLAPLTAKDGRRSAANKAIRALIDKEILEVHGVRLGLPYSVETATLRRTHEDALLEVIFDLARTGEGATLSGVVVECRNRVPSVEWDSYWLGVLNSLIGKGWLKLEDDKIAITRREVTLSELEAALPELEELVSAIKTINKWSRVFEAIRKAA